MRSRKLLALPALAMTSPALLMRNTSDDPEWRAWIYHDHVSWFAGSGYVAEKLFRDHLRVGTGDSWEQVMELPASPRVNSVQFHVSSSLERAEGYVGWR